MRGTYTVAFYDKTRGKWRRSRTPRNPSGTYAKKEGAERRAAKLEKRGIRAKVVYHGAKREYPSATRYSPNFTRLELNCKGTSAPGDCGCNGKNPSAAIQKELAKVAQALEVFRRILGRPISTLSGYRCPVHNRYVKGASQSMHMSGKATDLAVPRGEQDEYVRVAKQVPVFNSGGIGVYPNGGVHVDRRGWVARWNSY